MNVQETLLKILKNRYFLTSLVFILWMGFLDRDDLFTQINLDKKLEIVENQKAFYIQEIQKLKTGLYNLEKNPFELEKLAREKYYMKKDHEDLFVMVIKTTPKPKDSLINKIRSIFSKPIRSKGEK